MWTRSQDKQILLNLERLHVAESFKYKYDPPESTKRQSTPDGWIVWGGPLAYWTGEGTQDNHLLGKFTTKEAALAELDAIQQWIDSDCKGVYQVSKV